MTRLIGILAAGIAALAILCTAAPDKAFANYDRGVIAHKNKNFRLALREFMKSASDGHAESQFVVGTMLLNGRDGVPKDHPNAAYWYSKAAKQGHARAQYNLGYMFKKGLHTAPNIEKAIFWYRKAAEQGMVQAHINLGTIYFKGQGVPKDQALAAKYYLLPAERGVAKAQFNMAAIYANGVGLKKDLIRAYMWFSIALRAGLKPAIVARDTISKEMTELEVAEAKRLTSEWFTNWRQRQGIGPSR